MRRLRRSAPDAILLGGFWKLDPEQKRDSAIIESVAADDVVHSLKDALGYCLQAATGDGELVAESGRTSAPASEANRPVAV
jgi:hypothetical protein